MSPLLGLGKAWQKTRYKSYVSMVCQMFYPNPFSSFWAKATTIQPVRFIRHNSGIQIAFQTWQHFIDPNSQADTAAVWLDDSARLFSSCLLLVLMHWRYFEHQTVLAVINSDDYCDYIFANLFLLLCKLNILHFGG